MKNITFKTDIGAIELSPQNGLFPQESLSLRGWAPETNVNLREVSVSTPPREVGIEITYVATEDIPRDSFKRLLSLLHYSTLSNPLILSLVSDLDSREWFQHAGVTKVEAKTIRPTIAVADITLELLDGWWYSRGPSYDFTSRNVKYQYLDLPTDAPYDIASAPQSVIGDRVSGMAADSALLRFELNGAISRPTISCKSNGITNEYSYNSDIPAEERLVVDPIAHSAMIGSQNVIENAERGNGLNSGAYIFQPLPLIQKEGSSSWQATLTWTQGLAFTITPYYRSLNVW